VFQLESLDPVRHFSTNCCLFLGLWFYYHSRYCQCVCGARVLCTCVLFYFLWQLIDGLNRDGRLDRKQ
jgi:hypothetical protein